MTAISDLKIALGQIVILRTENKKLKDACERLSSAISRIDYALGPKNDMGVSLYDADCDEQRVIDRVAKEVKINLDANRFYRLMSGMEEDDYDKRAEHFMQQWLDGLTVGPNNRTSIKAALAEHFADIAKTKNERVIKAIEAAREMKWQALLEENPKGSSAAKLHAMGRFDKALLDLDML